jgi:hypothetical protein
MNEHELDLALGAIGDSRTRVSAPPVLRANVRAVPLESPSARGPLSRLNWRFLDMFSATKVVVGGVLVALLGGVLFASELTPPPPGAPGVAVSPSPSSSTAPAGIQWTTPVVDLVAESFLVEANGLEFTAVDAPLGASSDPGGPDYWTLEVEWVEQEREQRLSMYFGSDGRDWWVDEVRTRDGYDPAEWIYAYGPFFKTPLDQAYEGDVRIELLGEGRPRDGSNKVPGVLAIEGMRLEVMPRMPEDIAALPAGGGTAVKRDPFSKGGPLHCSGILRNPPAKVHERLLADGYRVAYRLEPYPGEGFDPTVPPEGVIVDTAVDSYGNLLLFVVGPELSDKPNAKLQKDCKG